MGGEVIITAQTYDGAAAMRYQAQGHIRSRLSAWGLYVCCRSNLLNLSVRNAIEGSMYDAYDTVHSTLVFLRDSPYRRQILFDSQKGIDSNKKGKVSFRELLRCQFLSLIFFAFTVEQTVPKASETRWSYVYELLQAMGKHYVAVVIALSTRSQNKNNGSSDGRRFALDLCKPQVAFQIHLMRHTLRPALQFLRQIEKRESCLDEFSLHVDATRDTIKQSLENFNFDQ